MTSPNPFDLLKEIIRLATSPVPLESKVEQVLRCLSQAFQSERCLLLDRDRIKQGGWLFHLLSERKPFWVEDGKSFNREGLLPEEEPLLCPAFAFIPLGETLIELLEPTEPGAGRIGQFLEERGEVQPEGRGTRALA